MTVQVQTLLQQARGGDASALGRLLESYRDYLTLLARVQVGRQIQGKVDAGDVVQEAYLDAHRQFGTFRGESEQELVAWLRRILAGKLALTMRNYLGTRGRDVNLERDLAINLDQSSAVLERGLIASQSSPSQHFARREEAVLLAEALGRLPEDYREVIVLRQLEALPFKDVAARMGRSETAVTKLWLRALERLRGEMQQERP
jgi:RNA polymerase sigma-70 factor (ECF subfamily)